MCHFEKDVFFVKMGVFEGTCDLVSPNVCCTCMCMMTSNKGSHSIKRYIYLDLGTWLHHFKGSRAGARSFLKAVSLHGNKGTHYLKLLSL